ncbi:MAG: phage minor head protein [Desulfobulbaceae bacterium]
MTPELTPLPMEEALDFWRHKTKLGPGEFARLTASAKVKAFAVSGIAKGAELDTVYNAMFKAMDKGITFEQFKAECGDIFSRRGWTGKRAWRVDNIFRTNIQTAYNVGRYTQLKEMTAAFPFWKYSAVNDSRTRPTHLAMNGKVFPAEHPFWDQWYPPNGFRCRCSVIPLTAGQVAKRGLKVESEIPQLIEPIDPVTGNTMPARQLIPDPGFAHHPGKAYWGGVVETGARGKFIDLPNLRGAADFRRRALDNVRPALLQELPPGTLLPPGLGDDFYRAEFLRLYGEEKVLTDPLGESVILSLRSFMADKTSGMEPEWKFHKPGHGELLPMLGEVLTNPFEIWLTPQQDEVSGRVRLTKRYVGLWKTDDKKQRVGGLAVFEVADGVFQGVTAFEPLKKGLPDLDYLDRQRLGHLLFGR